MALRSPQFATTNWPRDRTAIDVTRTKLVVYVLTAFGTAMVGALIFLQKMRISPDTAFSVNDWTAFVIFITVIGGIGRVEGPIIGTVVFFLLRQTLADLGSLYLLMLGAVAIAVMLFAPKGIWGLLVERFGWQLLPLERRLRLTARSPHKLILRVIFANRPGDTHGCEIRQGHHHLRHHRRHPHSHHVGRLCRSRPIRSPSRLSLPLRQAPPSSTCTHAIPRTVARPATPRCSCSSFRASSRRPTP